MLLYRIRFFRLNFAIVINEDNLLKQMSLRRLADRHDSTCIRSLVGEGIENGLKV